MQTAKTMQDIMEIFYKIIAIPHGSRNTQDMANFLSVFAKKHGYSVRCDGANNLLVFKKNEIPKVCFQSHYDMVCVGEAAKKLPLEPIEHIKNTKNGEEIWLSAKDSSLGADNGMGMAIMLYFMQQGMNAEFLFTNDEEIGMIGAKALELPIVSKILINLDSEVLGEITIGCAGGFDAVCQKEFTPVLVSSDSYFYVLRARGFAGGHSGIDIGKTDFIHKNAILESAKFLQSILEQNKSTSSPIIISWHGGEKRNSIPIHSEIIFASTQKLDICQDPFFELKEFEGQDSARWISQKTTGLKFDILYECLMSLPIGVIDVVDNLVQNSLNLSCISLRDEELSLEFMGRANTNRLLESSVVELKTKLLATLEKEIYGDGQMNFKVSGYYSPWERQTHATIKDLHMLLQQPFYENKNKMDTFERALYIMYESMEAHTKELSIQPEIVELHAGLECGILLSRFAELGLRDIIALSIGPTINSPHSVHEEVWLFSVSVIVSVLHDFMVKIHAE